MRVYVRTYQMNPLHDCMNIVLGKEKFNGWHPFPTDTFLFFLSCICLQNELKVTRRLLRYLFWSAAFIVDFTWYFQINCTIQLDDHE